MSAARSASKPIPVPPAAPAGALRKPATGISGERWALSGLTPPSRAAPGPIALPPRPLPQGRPRPQRTRGKAPVAAPQLRAAPARSPAGAAGRRSHAGSRRAALPGPAPGLPLGAAPSRGPSLTRSERPEQVGCPPRPPRGPEPERRGRRLGPASARPSPGGGREVALRGGRRLTHGRQGRGGAAPKPCLAPREAAAAVGRAARLSLARAPPQAFKSEVVLQRVRGDFLKLGNNEELKWL